MYQANARATEKIKAIRVDARDKANRAQAVWVHRVAAFLSGEFED